MKCCRILVGPGLVAVLQLTFGCGEPVSMGGTPSVPGTPEADYRAAYNAYLSWHRQLIQSLYATSQPNFPGAANATARCSGELTRMKALVDPSHHDAMDAIIQKYDGATAGFERMRAVSTRVQLEDWEHVVRRDFVFYKVKLIGAPAPDPAPVHAPPVPPPATETPAWVYKQAWENLQAQLKEAWTAEQDCTKPYEQLLETLRRWGEALSADRRPKVVTIMDAYRATFKATSGFREVPQGATREDVLNDLKVIESSVRLHLVD